MNGNMIKDTLDLIKAGQHHQSVHTARIGNRRLASV